MKKIFPLCLILLLLLPGCDHIESYTVVGNSMKPTLENGDHIIVNQNYYKDHPVQRGDIILFRYHKHGFIKRVIGLPNEKLFFKNGTVYIDGKEINPKFIFVPLHPLKTRVQLKAKEYFVLGDNLHYSRDSRFIGPILFNQIEGKVIKMIKEKKQTQ